jgi:hypothetical protein
MKNVVHKDATAPPPQPLRIQNNIRKKKDATKKVVKRRKPSPQFQNADDELEAMDALLSVDSIIFEEATSHLSTLEETKINSTGNVNELEQEIQKAKAAKIAASMEKHHLIWKQARLEQKLL